MLDQDLAENIRPGVVVRNPNAILGRASQSVAIALAVTDGGEQVDAGEPREGGGNRQQFGLGEGVGAAAAKAEHPGAGGGSGLRDHGDAIGDHRLIGLAGAIPFQHGEFRQVEVTPFAVAEHAREFDDSFLAGGEQLLAGEFRRRPQVALRPAAVRAGHLGMRRVQMNLVAGRHLQDAGFDLHEAMTGEPLAQGGGNRRARQQKATPVAVAMRAPPRRRAIGRGHEAPRSHPA